MTTLAVVGTATQVIGEIQSAKQQTRAIDQQLATQQQQIASQQVAELNDRQRQARREQARIKVAAGQAGLNISGSVTDLLNDSVMQNALAAERTNTNADNQQKAADAASGGVMDPAMAQSVAYERAYHSTTAAARQTKFESETAQEVERRINGGATPDDIDEFMMERNREFIAESGEIYAQQSVSASDIMRSERVTSS